MGELYVERVVRVDQGARICIPIRQPVQMPLKPHLNEVRAGKRHVQVLAPISQRDQIKFIAKIINLKPPVFKGEIDGMTSIYWKKSVKSHSLSLGTDQVQLQRFTTFTLEYYICKWWESLWSIERKFTATWAKLEVAFNRQFHSKGVKAMRWVGFYSLEHGDLLVVEFEWKFTSLSSFIPKAQLSEEEKYRMLEERLLPSTDIQCLSI